MERARTPYGLNIIQDCLSCPVREGALFCDVAPESLHDLNSIRQSSFYPAGAVLFVEGQEGRGVYVICGGRVKLTSESAHGRSAIVRIAGTGEVLGLSATISETTYVATAETLEPTQVNFIPQAEFTRFLSRHAEIAVRVARHLSMELRRAYQQISQVVLPPHARARLAALLLNEASRDARTTAVPGTRFRMLLTHQEIAQIIGSSRETVSRLLSDFREEGLIQYKGVWMTIADPRKLAGEIE